MPTRPDWDEFTQRQEDQAVEFVAGLPGEAISKDPDAVLREVRTRFGADGASEADDVRQFHARLDAAATRAMSERLGALEAQLRAADDFGGTGDERG